MLLITQNTPQLLVYVNDCYYFSFFKTESSMNKNTI